jgi:hypothetical protein
MIRPNHTIVAMGIVYTVGGSWGDIILAGATAGLPDTIEKIFFIRVLQHRGLSHDLLTWGIPAALAALFLGPGYLTIPQAYAAWTAFMPPLFHSLAVLSPHLLFAGPILHLAGDVLTTMGISFAKLKIVVPAFITGTGGEMFWTTLFSFGLVAYNFYGKQISSIPFGGVTIAAALLLVPTFFCRWFTLRFKQPIVLFGFQI